MTIVATPTPAPAPAPAPAPERGVGAGRGHLHQVDIVRLLTFAAVIGVHPIAFTQPPARRPWGAGLLLFPFGREVIFALTGFVLVYPARDRTLSAPAVCRKRVP